VIRDIKQEIRKLAITVRNQRDFGLLFCAVFAIGACILFYKGNPNWPWSAGAALIFLSTALLVPAVFRQPYRLWMTLAFTLGWFMTRVLLLITYAVIVTPLGVLMRASGKDLLDERIEKNAPSYWKKHDPISDGERYKKQF